MGKRNHNKEHTMMNVDFLYFDVFYLMTAFFGILHAFHVEYPLLQFRFIIQMGTFISRGPMCFPYNLFRI